MSPPLLAIVMDPMETVRPRGDTSFAFMVAAAARGWQLLHVLPRGVALKHDQVVLHGHSVEVFDRDTDFFRVVAPARVPAKSCRAIFIRTDPPFDEAYLTTTWLLTFAEQQGVRVVNSPRGLREANEHLYALNF